MGGFDLNLSFIIIIILGMVLQKPVHSQVVLMARLEQTHGTD